MLLDEQNPELLFIRHALAVMGNPPNGRTDIEPGGDWMAGNINLTWGLRTVTEPPTLNHLTKPAIFTAIYLPREIEERITIWKHRLKDDTEINFRDRVILTAILSWTPPTSTN